jgi:hypothetical protein
VTASSPKCCQEDASGVLFELGKTDSAKQSKTVFLLDNMASSTKWSRLG